MERLLDTSEPDVMIEVPCLKHSTTEENMNYGDVGK